MSIYVKIGETLYPASITGRLNDKDWDDRPSKAITLEMSYGDAIATFTDNVIWYIVQEVEEIVEEYDEETETMVQKTVIKTEEYDNSEYSIAGDIVDHRNGYVTVKMGKMTAELQKAQLEQEVEQLKAQNAVYESALTEIENALAITEE